MLQQCYSTHCAELRLLECFYIFLNTEMNKGLQNPVASRAVCRQRTAVPVELYFPRWRRGKASVTRLSPAEGEE